jgi:protein-disulfide isomerase
MNKKQQFNKTNVVMAVFATAIIVVVFLILFVKPDVRPNDNRESSSDQSLADSAQEIEDTETQLTVGDPDSEFAFTIYNDYKCSQCVLFHKNILPDIQEKLIDTGQTKLIVKNIPFMAQDSQRAAEGAYCALDQNLFAEYHSEVNKFVADSIERDGYDTIDQDILTTVTLAEIIGKNGGDQIDFTNCIEENRRSNLVTRDLKESERDQIRGTPTFIIGEQKITGAQSSRTIISVIESYIR